MAAIVDSLIERLMHIGVQGHSLTGTITEAELTQLCTGVRAVFLEQPSLIECDAPLVICGDTHGQYADLLRILARGGFPPTSNYLFLGDYVDRGKQNIETISLMFCYKLKYPENFFMLRGNHECANINRVYGFYDECQRRYTPRLWQVFQDVFNCMPMTGLVSNKILCMHGGLSPLLKDWDQLRQIRRPMDPPNPSLQMDLLWSDPDKAMSGWRANTRGVSYVYGQDVVLDFCQRMGIDMIARAHQVVQDGYEFFAGRKLVTIFSAPHYCGEFDNSAGMLKIDENLMCSFESLKATHDKPSAVRVS